MGAPASFVARRFGVSSRSVQRWRKAFRIGGIERLKARRVPGRPAKIRPARVLRMLERTLEWEMKFKVQNGKPMWLLPPSITNQK